MAPFLNSLFGSANVGSFTTSHSQLLHYAAILLIAPVLGVLLHYVLRKVCARLGGLRAVARIEPVAATIGAGIVLFSCYVMGTEAIKHVTTVFSMPQISGIFAVIDAAAAPLVSHASLWLSFLLGVGAGVALTQAVEERSGVHGNHNAAELGLLIHCATEGVGLALYIHDPEFLKLFYSLALHGIPEGIFVSLLSLSSKGIVRTCGTAAFTHIGQAAGFFLAAAYLPPISPILTIAMEGVALGSMLATLYLELLPLVYQAWGKPYGNMAVVCVTAACIMWFP